MLPGRLNRREIFMEDLDVLKMFGTPPKIDYDLHNKEVSEVM